MPLDIPTLKLILSQYTYPKEQWTGRSMLVLAQQPEDFDVVLFDDDVTVGYFTDSTAFIDKGDCLMSVKVSYLKGSAGVEPMRCPRQHSVPGIRLDPGWYTHKGDKKLQAVLPGLLAQLGDLGLLLHVVTQTFHQLGDRPPDDHQSTLLYAVLPFKDCDICGGTGHSAKTPFGICSACEGSRFFSPQQVRHACMCWTEFMKGAGNALAI